MRFVLARRNVSRLAICGLLIASIAASGETAKELYAVHVDGKRGFISRSGVILIQPKFDDVHQFSDGVAFVKVGGKWGLIDTSGEYRVEPRFDDARNCFVELCSVKVGDRWGFVNTKGEVTIPFQFDVARGFEDSGDTPEEKFYTARVIFRGKWELIDPNGKVYLKPSVLEASNIDELEALEEGLAPAKVGDKWGYIDRKGKTVIKRQFERAGGFSNGYAAVQLERNGQFGYIDKKGALVIPYKFEEAGEFEEGTQPPDCLAPVKLGGRWGYIDRNGKVVIQPQFDGARQFSNGLAEVQSGDTFGYIDHTGNYVWKPSK